MTTATRRQMYCSPSCGSKAQGRKIIIDPDILREAIATTSNHIEAAEKLGISTWTFYRRTKELGVPLHDKQYKQRSDGYWNYSIPQNHRRVMERHLGHTLSPKQGVHHINGDKSDNDLSNLIVTDGTSDHSRMHGSLEKCAFELVRQGMIGFDRQTRSYFVLKRVK